MNIAQPRRRAATPVAETLEVELDRIAAFGLNELRAFWLKMTGQGAPRLLSGALLARMIAHRIRERRLGKFTREMRQRLDGLARGGGEPVRHLKVGTVMVREHQGVTHEVIVVPGGFSWKEKTYPSLSAIALAITGTSWNGPRFFGLREKSGAEPPVEPLSILNDTPRRSARRAVRSMGALALAYASDPDLAVVAHGKAVTRDAAPEARP
jgi:Protein of unknown function (DUF2924)